MKIKIKKCVGVGCVAEWVEESRESEKRNGMFWNENGRILEALIFWCVLVKKKSIKKSQK